MIFVKLRLRSNTQYSHHQKLIICDSPNGLVAFLGGLDISFGRFDTPSHELFATLNNIHSDDYYNSVTKHKRKIGAPREPWHDCHAQVRGDIVWYMLSHFRGHFFKSSKSQKPRTAQINKRIYQMITELFPGNITEVSKVSGEWITCFYSSVARGKYFKKHIKVNDGVHSAYVTAINNAEKFIYIENQFFIGGSYLWMPPISRLAKIHAAPNSIPVLIADRIIQKARDNEQFKVYIMLPQIPDGKPGSYQINGILYYQFKTIEMVYHRITTAFKRMGIKKRVEDYIMFYCLGKVEWNEAKKCNEK
jgi:phospholipase D1/2